MMHAAAPTVTCPAASMIQCSSSNGTPVTLQAAVSDADADALTVVWSIDGVAYQTNSLSAGATTNATNEFTALFGTGQHDVTVTVSDSSNTVSCSTTVMLLDTIPPTIQSVRATPSTLWPPNHQFVPVTVTVVATDACGGAVTSHIKSITSNEPVLGHGDGHTSPDWLITGDLTAKLRAERAGPGKGRTYTITIESTDSATNSATATVAVLVPHDQRGHQSSDNGDDGNGGKGGNGKPHGPPAAIRAAAAHAVHH